MSVFPKEGRHWNIKDHVSFGHGWRLRVSTKLVRAPGVFVKQMREGMEAERGWGAWVGEWEGKKERQILCSVFSFCLSVSLPQNLTLGKGRRVGSWVVDVAERFSHPWRTFMRSTVFRPSAQLEAASIGFMYQQAVKISRRANSPSLGMDWGGWFTRSPGWQGPRAKANSGRYHSSWRGPQRMLFRNSLHSNPLISSLIFLHNLGL